MIIFGKKGAETIGRSQKEIYEKLFNESEQYLMQTMCQAMGMSSTGFPDELDENNVKLINQALGYWNQTKQLALASAELMDERDAKLRSQLEDLQREQESSKKILEEISRKLDKTSKTKAE